MPPMPYPPLKPPPLPPPLKREERRATRCSRCSARPTYRGLPLTIFRCISVTALVASSGDEKQTKPKPFDVPLSSVEIFADVIFPNVQKSSFNLSSVIDSSKFLMYKFTPFELAPLPPLPLPFTVGPNCSASLRARSDLDIARPTNKP